MANNDDNEYIATDDEIASIIEITEKEISNDNLVHTENSSPTVSINVDPILIESEDSSAKANITPKTDRDEDYEYTRNNIKETINLSKRALDSLLDLSESSGHPRAYEVFTSLVNGLVDANKKLMDLHNQKQRIEAEKEKQNTKVEKTVTNNNLFVGTPAQLDELIKKLKQS